MTNIRVATYNLKDFSIYATPHYFFEQKLYALSRVLDEVNADIIALQEIDSLKSLEVLNEALERPFDHLAFQLSNSRRQIHLAYLSRFPIQKKSYRKRVLKDEEGEEVLEYVTAESSKLKALCFSRDLLRAKITVSATLRLVLFNTHLKSMMYLEWMKNTTDRVRNAECYTIVRVINEYSEDSNDPIILLGDFNHTVSHHSIAAISTGLGFYDAINDELESYSEGIHSFHNKSIKSRIDYILLSSEAKKMYKSHSAAIYSSYPANKASDHYPVYLDLQF